MPASASETVFALATGLGKSAIAVVRISGPQTRFVLETITGSVPPPRLASLRRLTHPSSRQVLDEALVLFFEGPHSFTGEDTAEFHLHGGRAVVASVLFALGAIPSCRMAQPGEFTRRAFMNGKLDLTGVEAIADLIDADTVAQSAQALGQLSGRLREAADDLRRDLTHAMMLLEADLDFSDEGDVPTDSRPIRSKVETVEDRIRALLRDAHRGERIRDGLNVVILGEPNAGKSTLLNRLADRDVAIVTDRPGTTRDLLEVQLDLGGLPLTLIDTAGLRESDDPIEQEGIRRALERAGRADLLLVLIAPGGTAPVTPPGVPTLRLSTKTDSDPQQCRAPDSIAISAKTGAGLETLLDRLRIFGEALLTGEPAVVTRERHRLCLSEAAQCVERALDGFAQGVYPELISEELRLASRALERLVGRIDVEDILDSLFQSFCIGK